MTVIRRESSTMCNAPDLRRALHFALTVTAQCDVVKHSIAAPRSHDFALSQDVNNTQMYFQCEHRIQKHRKQIAKESPMNSL